MTDSAAAEAQGNRPTIETASSIAPDELQRLTDDIIAALKTSGIEARDIQTSQVSVTPQYAYAQGEAPKLTGYQASNRVTVTGSFTRSTSTTAASSRST